MIRIRTPVFLFLSFLGVSSAHASGFEKFIFGGGVSLGYTNYRYSLSPSRIIVPTVRLNAAVTYEKKVYVGVSYADTLSQSFISLDEISEEGTRTDLDIVIGYQPVPQWSFYLGYKDGETTRDRTFPPFFGRDEPIRFTSSFSHNGPFVGAGYSHFFEDAGKLSFNLAYYYMDARNDRSDLDGLGDGVIIDGFDDTIFDASRSQGFSYSLNWSIAVTGKTRYFNTLKYNDYRESAAGKEIATNQIVYFNIGLIQFF